MKIDSERLRILRKRKGFTRPQLAKLSGITVRTIQRLEREPHQSQKTREDTVIRLAKSLSVEPGVLTGELPLPESDDMPVSDQAPKTRLAYDLIKRRYGVSRTEIINMAPLFFVLLAEESLTQRHEKLKEAEEAFSRLWKIDGFWHGSHAYGEEVIREGIKAEKDSIANIDLFGEHLLDDEHYHRNAFFDEPFDSSKNNPFTHYLRKLADELDIPDIVGVDEGVLNIASDFKFPHYDICSKELDHIANGSPIARMCLETGCARLSEIPEELMAEDADEERTKWLEKRVLDVFKKTPEKENIFTKFIATSPQGDKMRSIFDRADSQKTSSETEKGENDE